MNRRYSVTACFDGNKRVVSGSEDNNIYVWDINSSKSVVQKLVGHSGESRWVCRDVWLVPVVLFSLCAPSLCRARAFRYNRRRYSMYAHTDRCTNNSFSPPHLQ